MKLFKSLLVAPATLGLLAPMSATANEVTINDFNPAEELAVTNSRVDGLEARLNNFEAGSFSETTTASFSADFYLGAEDTSSTETSTGIATDNDLDDSIAAGYSFQIDLNTSFTGEDSLDISLDAGNASGGIAEFDGNTGGDGLTVDGVSYTFPVGGATVFVGDNTDGSALFTTACVYGGPSDTLDDCGNVNAGITGGAISAGASYDFGNGFTVATGVQTGQKVLTEESLDSLALNAAYIGDNYGVSLTYSSVETSITEEDTATAFNAYYTPEGLLPSVSAGYEIVDLGGEAASVDEKESVFLGLTWDEVGAGSLGVAVGYSNIIEGSEEEYMYEAYYSYPINDGMTITPLLFVKENATSGLDNTTGVMVKTSFSF